MFATKKDITNWANDFLEKNKGQYLDPTTKDVCIPIKVGRYWKFDGQSDEWIGKMEDIKVRS